jgi:hypothetical protein
MSGKEFDEDAWRAVIGPNNTGYYLERFRAMAAGRPAARWHWPAFFMTWHWLLHRKMWGASFIYLLSPLLVSLVLGLAAAVGGAAVRDADGVLTVAVVAAYFLVPARFANRWYYDHCRKLMARMQARGWPSREAYLAALAARGGSGGAAVLIVVLVLVAVAVAVAIAVLVSVPAWRDDGRPVQVTGAALR